VGGYQVDAAALTHADSVLAGAATAARAALQGVRATADELLGSRWDGPAAAAYRAGWADWLTGMTVLLDGLEALAGALGSSAAGYAATEAEVRTAVARAAI
jgi:WXG100 family type VII secretion target